MIIHCETCNADLLETEPDRLALDVKDTHEFENGFEPESERPHHPVNIYIVHQGQRIRLAGLVGTIAVDI